MHARTSVVLAVMAAVGACAPKPAATTGEGTMDAGTTRSDASVMRSETGQTCADFTGVYRITGTCHAGVQIPTLACVRQDGCDVSVSTDLGVLTGSVTTGPVMLQSADGSFTCSFNHSSGTFACATSDAMCSGHASPLASASDQTLGACCDPGASVSGCNDGETCRALLPALDRVSIGVCAAGEGNVAEGEACVPLGGEPSLDDCRPGSTCTSLGETHDAGRRCRQRCPVSAPQCPDDRACFAASAASPGYCLRTCTLFDNRCGEQQHCLPFAVTNDDGTDGSRFLCTYATPLESANPCPFWTACNPDLVCEQGPHEEMKTCHAICDADHPCSQGFTCTASPEADVRVSLFGYCLSSS